ncbi:MAG TPA: type II toxin-antitoxin system HicB family antitoxin [Negativicutes bacterium]|nr:type II toxin-antitoxin system HicB family antitoxin [Negativicutes bacterium]
MNNMLEHKGYYGTVELSDTDNILFGKVIGINSLISYEGDSVQSLKDDFQGAVDDYLEMCAANGVEPEKMYRGSFNVRISPELHKALVIYSASSGQTLNATVEEAIKRYFKKTVKRKTTLAVG